MITNTVPPTRPITKEAVGDPINHPKPNNNNRTMTISMKICPLVTKGPAMNPFLKESDMVTVSMGPGTSAPDNPTRKEVIANRIISIIKNHLAC
jgi:hypothetical protein